MYAIIINNIILLIIKKRFLLLHAPRDPKFIQIINQIN